MRDVILDGEAAWDPAEPDGVPRVRHPLARRPRRDRAAARGAARAAEGAAACARRWRASPELHDEKPWERALRRGLGRRHRQAARLALRAPPLAALAEDEVRGDAGARGRRLHRSAGRARRLGALLVGYFEGDDFVFAGKIGTGFDTKLLLDLRARLDALEIPAPPFTKGTGLPRLRVALGAARDRRPGRLHRVDEARQAAPSAAASASASTRAPREVVRRTP